MAKVRLGFVGVGGMGQAAHLQNYATLEDAEVVAIAELREDLGKRVAAKYGVPKVYRNHTELFAGEKLDGIVNIQGFQFHAQLLPDVFKAGLPIITEKPIASSVEAGRKIIAALKQTKARYYVGYHKRSDPATMWAKQQIAKWEASGEVGKMRYVRVTMPPGDWVAGGFNANLWSSEPIPGMSADPKPDGMSDVQFKHYGGLVNYYIHQINLMRHLFGADYHVKYADRNSVTMTVESDTGVSGLIEMAPFSNSISWQESATVCFDRGWIRIDLPAPLTHNRAGRVQVYSDVEKAEPYTYEPALPWVHAMRQQAINFVKAIKGESTPLAGPEDALKDLEVTKEYLDLYIAAGGKLG